MCGIFCLVRCAENETSATTVESLEWSLCKDVIASRGPDSLNGLQEKISKERCAQFQASVLWTQGPQLIPQPLVDSHSNILLWNGDILAGSMLKEDICDSKVVLDALQNSTDIFCTLKEIKGPFSFCYYQKSFKLLYFARDRFGRHSLLFKADKNNNSLLLTSVAVKKLKNLVELPALGVFIADLNEENIKFKCIPWFEPNERFQKIITDLGAYFNISIEIVETEYLPKIGKLDVPGGDMGFVKYSGLLKEYKSYGEVMDHLLKISDIDKTVNNLLLLLNESVRRRVTIIPKFCKNCTTLSLKSENCCHHAKVGVLFSGGLDSAILAALTHNHIDISETIDLINIAFQKKPGAAYDVPDRLTGRRTYDELSKLFPERKFNLIEVNISVDELYRYRSTHISNLTYPLVTVLDDGLACAVWFASRTRGVLYPHNEACESTSRVLLLGMGADEQFGGYMRHRAIMWHKKWEILVVELKLQFDRISERNLGRDDRVVADHGKQLRLPYLDEDFVQFVQSLPPWERCCPTEDFPTGLGDKLLLRLLANKIGLRNASTIPKRALQFGARIANSKENASDLSKHL